MAYYGVQQQQQMQVQLNTQGEFFSLDFYLLFIYNLIMMGESRCRFAKCLTPRGGAWFADMRSLKVDEIMVQETNEGVQALHKDLIAVAEMQRMTAELLAETREQVDHVIHDNINSSDAVTHGAAFTLAEVCTPRMPPPLCCTWLTSPGPSRAPHP
jgi:hypothetical protein